MVQKYFATDFNAASCIFECSATMRKYNNRRNLLSKTRSQTSSNLNHRESFSYSISSSLNGKSTTLFLDALGEKTDIISFSSPLRPNSLGGGGKVVCSKGACLTFGRVLLEHPRVIHDCLERGSSFRCNLHSIAEQRLAFW